MSKLPSDFQNCRQNCHIAIRVRCARISPPGRFCGDWWRSDGRTSRSLFNRRSGAVTIYASSPRTCNNHSPFIKPRSHLSDSSVPLDVRTSSVSNFRRRVMIGECLLSDPSGANLSLVFSFFSSFSFSARKWFLFSNPRVDLYTTEYFDRKFGDKEG